MSEDRQTMPIGPQHPLLKEPALFKLTLDGSTVEKAELHIGYVHRGIEQLMEGREIEKGLHTVEKTCGICSYAHSGCFTIAAEKLLGVETPLKVKLYRVIIAELERIHSHLMSTGITMNEIGLQTLFMFFWREREGILEIFERLTGNRINHAINLIGTTKREFTHEDLEFTKEKLNGVLDKIGEYRGVIEKNDVAKARLHNVGVISKEMAKEYCLVGPVARACGIKLDTRREAPYEAYEMLKPRIITREEGDAMARTLLRLDEVCESIRMINRAIEMMPSEKISEARIYPAKDGMGTGRLEAPRGENFYHLEVENGKISRLKIRTPTFANIMTYPKLVEGKDITDLPVVVASMDPCFGCLDRMIVINGGKAEMISTEEMKRRYVV